MSNQYYYQQAAFSVDPITLCEAFPFCFGNVLKYLMRANFKGDKCGDLRKAMYYLDRHLSSVYDVSSVTTLLSTNTTLRTLMLSCNNEHVKALASGLPIDMELLKSELLEEIDRLNSQA